MILFDQPIIFRNDNSAELKKLLHERLDEACDIVKTLQKPDNLPETEQFSEYLENCANDLDDILMDISLALGVKITTMTYEHIHSERIE